MDINELEKILSKYSINKPKYSGRSKKIEHTSLPFMLTTFRGLLKDEIPPTQSCFINTFKDKYPNLRMNGLTSRLKRAYLSYIREYHLGYLLKLHFKNVVYNEEIDIAGVDYVIYYKRKKFNIHAYVNTENGRYWRGIKNERHTFVGRHLDLPMDLDKGKRCGKIILYTDDMIKVLKKQMDEAGHKK